MVGRTNGSRACRITKPPDRERSRAAGPHSMGNVLLQLDGRPALELYERYLGADEIEALPGSALLFPLQIHDPKRPDHQVVRTVLAVDRDKKSMTFAGDDPLVAESGARCNDLDGLWHIGEPR